MRPYVAAHPDGRPDRIKRDFSVAYLDLDNMFAAPKCSGARTGKRMAAESLGDRGECVGTFSALEWSVIALAKRDTLRSLAVPGRLSRAMGSLFGLSTSSRLADPQLEALRRIAVHAWRRGFAVPKDEITRFHYAGFTDAQLETLVVSVTGMRVASNQRVALAA